MGADAGGVSLRVTELAQASLSMLERQISGIPFGGNISRHTATNEYTPLATCVVLDMYLGQKR